MTDLVKKIRFVVDTLHDRDHEVSLQNVWSSLHTIYGDKIRGKITRDEVNQILIKPKKKPVKVKKEETSNKAILPG